MDSRLIRLHEDVADLRAEIARLVQGEATGMVVLNQVLRLVELEARIDEHRRMKR